jgi:hypothetical protein
MRSGHHHATLARMRTQDVVLCVPDTTVLDDGTTPPKKGMGSVKVKVREASRRHPPVAFPPARMHLGGLGLQMWQRAAQPVAQERHRPPLAATESSRWVAGDQLACEVPHARSRDARRDCGGSGRGDAHVVSGGAAAFAWRPGGRPHARARPSAYRQRARAAFRVGGQATAPPPTSGSALAPRAGAGLGPARWLLRPHGRRRAGPHVALAGLPTAPWVHLCGGNPANRQCPLDMYNSEPLSVRSRRLRNAKH